jgi:hypothetical protein
LADEADAMRFKGKEKVSQASILDLNGAVLKPFPAIESV